MALDPRLVDACGDRPGWACEVIWDASHNSTLSKLGDFVVHTPLKIVLILVGALVVNRMLLRVIRRFVNTLAGRATSGLLSGAPINPRAAARTQTIGIVLRSLATATVYSFTGLVILGEIGINLGPLIAGAGIAGVAIGFGAQTLVKDFLSGIFMLIEDQYGVGDVVDLGLATGTVEAVNLRSTRVRSADGTVWHVPNGGILRVGNKSQDWSRALLDVTVAYDADIRRASEVIKQVADEMAEAEEWKHDILEPPEVWGVEHIRDGAVVIRLVLKMRPGAQFKLMRELRLRIKEALEQAGIATPVPPSTPTE
ncbi:MAG: moderate conductance mechanosensitive channel [Acidimicrobiaceae bacterium]|jgi:small conductance mechanosensitive channel